MPRVKTKSIQTSPRILFTIKSGDVTPLKFYEDKMSNESGRDILEIPDAEIIRHAIHRAYQIDRKKKS
jgi:hypothetical protein